MAIITVEDYMQPEDGDTDKETTLFDDLMQALTKQLLTSAEKAMPIFTELKLLH